MKKTFLVFAAVAAIFGVAAAQDTVNAHEPVTGYLYDSVWSLKERYYVEANLGPATGGEWGKRFVTDDTLTVYGIAASVCDLLERYPYFVDHYVYDTSYANSIEYIRLYDGNTGRLVTLAQSEVHMRTTPVSYYMNFDTVNPPNPNWVVPIYERYFDTPVQVQDSFYAGMTFFIERPYAAPNGIQWYSRYPPLGLYAIASRPMQEYFIIGHMHRRPDGSTYCNWGYGRNANDYALLFPILTPNPNDTTTLSSDTTYLGDTLIVTDTVIIGGDTIITTDTILTIENGGLLDRLTGVMPNPAVGTAKVVSSFGISMVEAYDMGGTLVHRQKADGLATTLDVRHWPTGTYLLRIHTPQGTAVKKLVVRR